MLFRRLALIVVLLQAAAFAESTYSFTLLPTHGLITGDPDQMIGWGYTLSNRSSTDWLVPTAMNSSTSFLYATGEHLFDFPVLDPGASVTVPFDAMLPSGLFKLTWDTNVPIGTENAGTFILSAEWWSGNPATDGEFLRVAQDASQPYVATSSSTVPEPTSATLLGLGIALGVARFRVKRQL